MQARNIITLFVGVRTLIRLVVVALLFIVFDFIWIYLGPVGGDTHIGCPIAYESSYRLPPPLPSGFSFDPTKVAANVAIYWAIAILWSLRARSRAARTRRRPVQAPSDRS